MPALTPLQTIVMSSDIGGGKAIYEMKAPRVTVTLEIAEDSPWTSLFSDGAVVKHTIEIVSAGAPVDQLTTTALQSSSGQNPGQPGIVDPATGQFLAGQTFKTPEADIPAPTITDAHPAAVTSNLMSNAPIADVKAALGLG